MISLRLLTAVLAGLFCAAAAVSSQASNDDAGIAGKPQNAAGLPAPDYASASAWAAWPGRQSGAAAVPANSAARDRQAEARADVFFIHPTTYLSLLTGNAPYDAAGKPKSLIESYVLRFQASAFNGCCRIFAPRYRQASLGTFFRLGPAGEAALNLAYSDVLRAFDYYLAYENRGRPFIIASHSQGSIHAMRLLQERVAGTPLQGQLIAAYTVGSSLPAGIEKTGLPVCRDARETGCVINWATVKRGHIEYRRQYAIIWLDGRYQELSSRKIVCVNPLTWSKDGSAPADANPGALPAAQPHQPMPPTIPMLTGAACEDGLLGVHIPFWERTGFSDILTVLGSYHDFDYNLFYMSIRQNAEDRAAAFSRIRPRFSQSAPAPLSYAQR
jgi:Protein of unknown function (DUF3089)